MAGIFVAESRGIFAWRRAELADGIATARVGWIGCRDTKFGVKWGWGACLEFGGTEVVERHA